MERLQDRRERCGALCEEFSENHAPNHVRRVCMAPRHASSYSRKPVVRLSYVIIQGPAFAFGCGEGNNCSGHRREHWWALAGFITCIISFIEYLVFQVVYLLCCFCDV